MANTLAENSTSSAVRLGRAQSAGSYSGRRMRTSQEGNYDMDELDAGNTISIIAY